MRHYSPGEIYHIYNRGVDKRKIFLDGTDFVRFIHDLYEFNDEDNVFNLGSRFKNVAVLSKELQNETKKRKILVDILAFALMPNHFHLMLRARDEKGIPEFMKKIGGGFAQYFNQKYKRTGALFEGKYKCVHVADDQHLLHLLYYIHTNPLSLKFPQWKEEGLPKKEEVLKYLEHYRWSSFFDYIGQKNFPSVTNRRFLLEFCNGSRKKTEILENLYKKDFINWLKERKVPNLDEITYPHHS